MGRGTEDLYMSVPSFFRCPISLDVMKSPVSLCTGITYDRCSIQRWLDGGNNTCPATMQVLPSKDFVPNHTLHRLIQIWSNSVQTRPESHLRFNSLTNSQVLHLIDQIPNTAANPEAQFECFLKILCFASESAENRKFLAQNDRFILMLIQKMAFVKTNFESVDVVVKILQLIVESHDNKTKLRTVFLSNNILHAMAQVLKRGRPDSRIAIAIIIETIASDRESKIMVVESEDLLSQLIRGLDPDSDAESAPSSVVSPDAFFSCLIALSTPKRNKTKIVRAGLVKQLGRLLAAPGVNYNAELAFKLLEMVAGCSDGRMAISEDSNCVPKVVQKLLKGSEGEGGGDEWQRVDEDIAVDAEQLFTDSEANVWGFA
ncbi:hypothetical protein Ancab_002940 [Ancistrocladus abbreviatus]